MKKTGLKWLMLSLIALLVISFTPVSAVLAADDREAIPVSADQRDLVLAEMRNFLIAVQDIVLAIADHDMAAVSEAARTMGPGKGRGMSMGMSMPMEFRQMGRSTHMAFAELAHAADMGPEGVMADLGTLMSNCTGCHGTFKLVIKP